MNHSDYQSSADAEVSKALRHAALQNAADRKRRSTAAALAIAAGTMVVPWLELPRIPALVIGCLVSLTIFNSFECRDLRRRLGLAGELTGGSGKSGDRTSITVRH